MALIAGDRGMSTSQREAVHVLIDLLNRNLPAAHRMTVFACRAHLAAVDIGMAVGAFCAHIREDQFGMAGCTCNAFVHATQWVLGRIVIEFRRAANRLPAINRVTVLAGQIERPMRAMCVRRRLLRRRRNRRREQQQPHQQRLRDQSRDQAFPTLTSEIFPKHLVRAALNRMCA